MPLQDLYVMRLDRDELLAHMRDWLHEAGIRQSRIPPLEALRDDARYALDRLKQDPLYPQLSTLPGLRNEMANLQEEAESLQERIQRADEEGKHQVVETLSGELDAVLDQQNALRHRMAPLEAFQDRVDAAQEELDARQAEVDAANAALDYAEGRAAYFQAAADEVSAQYAEQAHGMMQPLVQPLEAGIPVALLPVRLETRFLPGEGGGTDLLVRVYPDDLHQDSHEPGLTDAERAAGERWAAETEAAADDAGRLRAWTALTDRFGAPRAAWIARVMEGGAPDGDRGAEWTRAAHSTVLPDQWMALGYKDGRLAFSALGNPIPDPLPTGPAPGVGTGDGGPEGDPGMRWMIDFRTAVEQGMALRIPLTPAEAQGIDRLVVTGVKAALDAGGSADRLEGLLDAHRHTWGAAFLPLGTPTNSASERAGATGPAGPAAAYDAERRGPLFQEEDGSDGDLAARALGVPARALARLPGAGGRGVADAGEMNNALWAVTWRYYATQMLQGQGPAGDPAAWRAWVRRYVRAGGPLPALRVANQPYGILPVTPLGESGGEGWGIPLLRRLRAAWRRAVPWAPHVGRTGDPDRDLTEVLRMEPVSGGFAGRSVAGGRYALNLAGFAGQAADVADHLERGRVRAAEQFAALGVLGGGRIPGTARSSSFPVPVPLTRGAADNADLQWMVDAAPDALRKEEGRTAGDSLLYLLLRHALLLEHGHAAAAVLGVPLAEPELVEMPGDAEDVPTVWERITQAAGSPALATAPELVSTRASITALADRDPRALATHLAGTLDVASHRLDAWITAVAAHRLDAIRRSRRTGVHLGGYGWVENLRPAGLRAPVTPPVGIPAPVYEPASGGGYVHAPSLSHAATAAVLRSGYLARSASPDEARAYDVDLSSARVRAAQWVMDGVRQGQPLGAVMGYRFERALQENHPGADLSRFVQELRSVAPLAVRPVGEAAEGGDPPAGPVVDGLELVRRLRMARESDPPAWSESTIPFGKAGYPAGADQARVEKEIEALEDALDAVADLGIAEGVFQAVRGNHARAGAVLDALSRGDVPPPAELEVVRTPRTGVAATHRVLVLVEDGATRTGSWAGGPRADAEPRLNAWVSRLLADPARVAWRAEYRRPGESALLASEPFTLAALQLAPLDAVALAPAEGGVGAAMEGRLRHHALERWKTLRRETDPARPEVTLRLAPEGTWPADRVSVAQFLEGARAVRDLLAVARAADARDLALPEAADGVPAGVDVAELAGRAGGAEEMLAGAIAAVTPLVDPRRTAALTDGEWDALRGALRLLAELGVDGAFPAVPHRAEDGDEAALREAGRLALGEAARRQARVDALEAEREGWTQAPPDAEAAADHHVARLHAVFGEGFRVAPRFVPAGAAETLAAFAHDAAAATGDPLASVTWLQRTARVRDGAGRLEGALTRSELLGADADAAELRVAQLPHDGTTPWIAARLPAGAAPAGGLLSLVAHASSLPAAPADGTPWGVAALVVDEWSETIPGRKETTAVTFHYDAPSACAPQAVLLAVPPDPAAAWSTRLLETTLLETAELARLRVARPHLPLEAGQPRELDAVLPALYVAHNPGGGTVSTDFLRSVALS